ncbi:MAG: xerD 2 [Acidobacteria bacterium]|nr:xerD 2 [Acidobacteriota bacterium]
MNSNGRLWHNPAERLALPRKEQPLPHVLNESDIARLIETPDTTTAIGIRDRALMETLYATGIRHAEAHRLDLYDVDTAAQRLAVRLGKGQRDRLVPLTETAAHWLSRYVTARVRSWLPASGGAKVNDVASRNSFHQLRLCGCQSPAVVSLIK